MHRPDGSTERRSGDALQTQAPSAMEEESNPLESFVDPRR
jgi:hypothetical protein